MVPGATQISLCASCCVAWTESLDVITRLNVAHFFRCGTAIFQHNPRAHWRIQLIPPRSFQNSSAVKIRFSHSQTFTNSHFHFFTLVESAISQVLPALARYPKPYQALPPTQKGNTYFINTNVRSYGTLLTDHSPHYKAHREELSQR
jgi:hypothetical protein